MLLQLTLVRILVVDSILIANAIAAPPPPPRPIISEGQTSEVQGGMKSRVRLISPFHSPYLYIKLRQKEITKYKMPMCFRI